MSYKGVYNFFGPFVRNFYNLRVSGAENEPKNGPFIVCPNHISAHDPVIVDAALHHQMRFFAKAELFRIPLLKQLITSLGAYPVNRGASDVRAIRKTVEILENGECVCIFPQGTRYTGVKPNASQTRSGVGMIAFRSKAPVLPVLIQTKGWKVSPFKRVNVVIGKPITYDELGFTTGNKSEYERASEIIFDRISAMITDDYGEDTLMLPKPKEKYQLWEEKKSLKALPSGERKALPEGKASVSEKDGD